MRATTRVAIAGAVLALSANSWAEPATSLDFLSFEGETLAWTSSGSIGLSDDATDGLQSLAVTGCGWLEISSPQFAASLLPAVDESITFDFFVPEDQPNPWWIGDIGVLISIPSAGIYHTWLGQQLLNDAERGVWLGGEISLPPYIQQALEGEAQDVSVHLVVNTSSCAQPLLIDNIRFAEDTGPAQCSADSDCDTGYCQLAACSDEIGICSEMPASCEPGGEAVCGCDGLPYANACEAAAAGVSVDPDGVCIISDDFGDMDLASHWRFLDPLGDSGYLMTGSQAVLQLAGGAEHNLWKLNKNAIRLLQSAPNEDFGIEVGYESTPFQNIDSQGVIVQQTDDIFLRFGMFSNGTELRLFSAFVDGTNVVGFWNRPEAHGVVPLYTRVERAGDDWSYSYSEDGVTWVNAVMFNQPMTVTEVGVYAINAGTNPEYDAVIDYFSNLDAPVTDTD